MKLYQVNQRFDTLLLAALRMKEGLSRHEATAGVKQNTLAVVARAYDQLAGNPETNLVGSENAYNFAVSEAAVARSQFDAAEKAGANLLMTTVGVLKPVLGQRWNAQWAAAGFSTPSLNLSGDPVPFLLKLQSYLTANPAHENAPLNVTAANLGLVAANIRTAKSRVDEARSKRKGTIMQRNADRQALFTTLLNCRRELLMLLPADDERWYSFGLDRPIDGRIPGPVEMLSVVPLGNGKLQVGWSPAVRAKRYRLQYRLKDAAEETTATLVVTDPRSLIEGLTAGARYLVRVSGLNSSGESQPAEAEAVVA